MNLRVTGSLKPLPTQRGKRLLDIGSRGTLDTSRCQSALNGICVQTMAVGGTSQPVISCQL
jgi:hypothetical protein